MINMTVANDRMFNLAKNEGEPLFIQVITNSIYKPIDIAQAFDDDDKKRHFDVKMLEYDNVLKTNAWHYIDVKDVEEKNFNTGNYVLRKPFIEFHTELKPYGYYTAFRLIENGKRTDSFLLVNTQEMLAKCKLTHKNDYALISLNEIKSHCDCKHIQIEEIF